MYVGGGEIYNFILLAIYQSVISEIRVKKKFNFYQHYLQTKIFSVNVFIKYNKNIL